MLTVYLEDDESQRARKEGTNFVEQRKKAIVKTCRSLDKAQRCFEFGFDKRFRKSHDSPTVGGWIFQDKSDAVSKPSGNDISNLTHLTEGS